MLRTFHCWRGRILRIRTLIRALAYPTNWNCSCQPVSLRRRHCKPRLCELLSFSGVQREFGSVEQGKIANPWVLLDANPAEDISALGRVRAVIVRGCLLDRAKLDDLVAAPKKAASPGQ